MKAQLFDKCGVPLKGFSVAIRAANIAYRARLLPALWQAISAVANVLVHLREFEAATKLLGAIMPHVSLPVVYLLELRELTRSLQALECEDAFLAAQSYSCFVDAQMGLAGQAATGTTKRKERLTKAIEYIDRAFDGTCW